MKNDFTFVIQYFQDEDGVFTAVVPAIKGCIVSGETLEEAYKNATEAIESCLEARKAIQKDFEITPYEKVNTYRVKTDLLHA